MADKNELKPPRDAFEAWLNKTIDCKYEYTPGIGYVPQEVYQLHQAFLAGYETLGSIRAESGDRRTRRTIIKRTE